MSVKIKTKPFGEIEISELQIFDFPDGILGFDFVNKFAVIDSDDEESPFKWLQAVEETELAFVVIQPESFMKNYKPMISHGDIEAVNVGDVSELLIFAIVTIPDNPSEMTANLQGPVILNVKERVGRQAISTNDRYKIRHSIMQEMSKKTGTGG